MTNETTKSNKFKCESRTINSKKEIEIPSFMTNKVRIKNNTFSNKIDSRNSDICKIRIKAKKNIKRKNNNKIVEFKNYDNLTKDEIEECEKEIEHSDFFDSITNVVFSFSMILILTIMFYYFGMKGHPNTDPFVRAASSLIQSVASYFIFHILAFNLGDAVNYLVSILKADDDDDNDDYND